MKFELYDGFDSLAGQLSDLSKRINNPQALNEALHAGAKPICDEIRNQIDLKAKYTSPGYKKGKLTRGELKRSLKTKSSLDGTEFKNNGYFDPYIKIGFTSKGAHSNILENSQTRVLRHLRPAFEIRRDEAMSEMKDTLYQWFD